MRISIHALLAESDDTSLTLIIGFSGFLSTLSLRRATFARLLCLLKNCYFYPRSPCGERQNQPGKSNKLVGYFYPRSPCGERLFEYIKAGTGILFLSTLSLRRATRPQATDTLHHWGISIHALLAESDAVIVLPL